MCDKYDLESDWLQYVIYKDIKRWQEEFGYKKGFTPDKHEEKGGLPEHDYSVLSTRCGFADGEAMKISAYNLIRAIRQSSNKFYFCLSKNITRITVSVSLS